MGRSGRSSQGRDTRAIAGQKPDCVTDPEKPAERFDEIAKMASRTARIVLVATVLVVCLLMLLAFWWLCDIGLANPARFVNLNL